MCYNTGIMHKLLHLQHHSHTAKHLPHHHTSYRSMLLVVVLLGSLLVWTFRASALDYGVSAAVMAPLPAGSPVVETPDDGAVFSTSDQVLVTGTCTVIVPALLVILIRDGVPIGSGVCQADGTFRIPITMVLGQNIIAVKYKTITGEDGPPGQTIVLYYNPPKGTTPSTNGSDEPASPADPLIIDTVDFVPFALGETVRFSVAVRGGKPPYTVKLDWGDGSVEVFTVQAAGHQELSHVYKVARAQMVVMMEAVDQTGASTRLHLAAVYKAGKHLITEEPMLGRESVLDGWITKGLWFVYGMAFLAVFSVWWHAKNKTATRAAYIVAPKRGGTKAKAKPRSRRV